MRSGRKALLAVSAGACLGGWFLTGATAYAGPDPASIELKVGLDKPQPDGADTVAYKGYVTNAGPDTATQVKIRYATWRCPSETAAPADCTKVQQDVVTLKKVTPGQPQSLQILVQKPKGANLILRTTLEVVDADQDDKTPLGECKDETNPGPACATVVATLA
jgi:hypothetical protein